MNPLPVQDHTIASPTASGPTGRLRVRVSERVTEAADVISLRLVHPSGEQLPTWDPGAHIDIEVAGVTRQYSLSDAVPAPGSWRIAVLREPTSRGGSRAIHATVHAGTELIASAPRNRFPLLPAQKYIFVAGGIGITPILPMIGEAERRGAEWSLVYGGRKLDSMAFVDEVMSYGDRVTIVPEDTKGRVDFSEHLRQVLDHTLIYACGPAPLLDALAQASNHWPTGSLHVEHFVAQEIDSTDDVEFEVEFAASGVTAMIPPDRSILDVANDLGLPTLSSCEEGVCGTCQTAVWEGDADHRDSVMTDEEKASASSMFICVSRSKAGSRLKLDL
ncbi:ferredoxin-NADP reductase [Rhodococcus sp. SMB37]|uniref:PDR/VanB family oxidoreductase n=1 Tax=Rhodococcus sp. SMB37 TaxID=2512213 RepID=UPI00104E6F00|nr:PDR/VanB family oxidoreductase [Rhodococcus sp. SMB37]TCN53416.1 ferredoxin-NADP reductase [Rhodococcus sp. SMB37]